MGRRLLAFAATLVLGAWTVACGGDQETPRPDAQATPAPTPVLEIASLTGRTTSVRLDPGFVDVLRELTVSLDAVGDGQLTGSGSLVLPITGGEFTYYRQDAVTPFAQGRIEHSDSAITLTTGRTTVELAELVVDPDLAAVTGTVSVDDQEVAGAGTPLLALDGRTLEPLVRKVDGTAVLRGATASLRREAADLLNRSLKRDGFREGAKVGTIRITLNAGE